MLGKLYQLVCKKGNRDDTSNCLDQERIATMKKKSTQSAKNLNLTFQKNGSGNWPLKQIL